MDAGQEVGPLNLDGMGCSRHQHFLSIEKKFLGSVRRRFFHQKLIFFTESEFNKELDRAHYLSLS